MFGLKLPSQLKKGAAEEEHSRKKAAGEIVDVVDPDAHLAWKRNRGGPVWGVKTGPSTQANPSSPADNNKVRAGWNIPPPPPALNISEDVTKGAPENPPSQPPKPAWGGAGLVKATTVKVEEKKVEPTWADMSDDEGGPLPELPDKRADDKANDASKVANDRNNTSSPSEEMSGLDKESPRRLCGCGMHTNPDHKCEGKTASDGSTHSVSVEARRVSQSNSSEGESSKGEDGNPTTVTPRNAGSALGSGRFGGQYKREERRDEGRQEDWKREEMRRDGQEDWRRDEIRREDDWRRREEGRREEVRQSDRWGYDRRPDDRWRDDGRREDRRYSERREDEGRPPTNWRDRPERQERRDNFQTSAPREVATMPTPTMILRRPADAESPKKSPPPSPQQPIHQEPVSPPVTALDRKQPEEPECATEPDSPSKRSVMLQKREADERAHREQVEAPQKSATEGKDDGKEGAEATQDQKPVKILSRPQNAANRPTNADVPQTASQGSPAPVPEEGVQGAKQQDHTGAVFQAAVAPVDMATLSLNEGDASRVYVVPVMAPVLPVDPTGMGVQTMHGPQMMMHPGHMQLAGRPHQAAHDNEQYQRQQRQQQQSNQQLFAQQYQQLQLQAQYLQRQQQAQDHIMQDNGQEAPSQQRVQMMQPQVYLVQGPPQAQQPPGMDRQQPMMGQLSPAQQAQLLMLSPAQQQELQRQVHLQHEMQVQQMQAAQHKAAQQLQQQKQEPQQSALTAQQLQQKRLLERQKQNAPEGSLRQHATESGTQGPQAQRSAQSGPVMRGPGQAPLAQQQQQQQAQHHPSRVVVQSGAPHAQAQQQYKQAQAQQQRQPVPRQPQPAARGGHQISKPRPVPQAQAQPQQAKQQAQPQDAAPRPGPGRKPAAAPAQAETKNETKNPPAQQAAQPLLDNNAQQRAKPGPREPYVHPRARQQPGAPAAAPQKDDSAAPPAGAAPAPAAEAQRKKGPGPKGPKTPRASAETDKPKATDQPQADKATKAADQQPQAQPQAKPKVPLVNKEGGETAPAPEQKVLTPRDRTMRQRGRGVRARGRGGHDGSA